MFSPDQMMSQLESSLQHGLEIEGDPAPLSADMVRRCVVAAIAVCDVPIGPIELGVAYVDAARIRDLNREHRGVDACTDVLSFPIDGCAPLPPGLPRQLGDVVVCTPYVAQQFEAGQTMVPRSVEDTGDATLEAALARCIVHGVLHLLGEDHEVDEAAARQMFTAEERALSLVDVGGAASI